MRQKGIGIQIKNLSNDIFRYINKYLSYTNDSELSPMQTFFINYIGKNGVVFQGELEQEFNIRRSTATGILQHMEKADMIERSTSKDDGRLKEIILTNKGTKYASQTDLIFSEINQLLSVDISEEELKVFFNVIEKIHKNIDRGGCYVKNVVK
ncbi:MarR family winged helix-turn-helix transcriptional regulator [Vagococcus vulneris]|uniref:HTH marR-type domain-containing protein n=1 Tax=Vagococcus vulneris TaxID=1977869 RepID=A0A429ZPR7_9ENTE|nr:MarR family winged helix-turn-helix transcriptional regulator [Vagococcus vulneris]RST95694.1 hypothetical protein CBF37_11365 [Vagococcus vulneris]